MRALRVPCDARMSWRNVKLAALKQHIPKSPAHPPLLGKPERDWKTFRREGAPPTKACKQRVHWSCCGRRALAENEDKKSNKSKR